MTNRAVLPPVDRPLEDEPAGRPDTAVLARPPSPPRTLLAVVWFAGLVLLGGAVYLAPVASARLLLLLAVAIPAARLTWSRPELGVVATSLVTAGLVRRDLITVPVAGIRLDLADISLIAALTAFVVQGLYRGAIEVPRWSISGPLLAFTAAAVCSALYARFIEGVNLGLVLGELRPTVYYAGCAILAAAAVRSGRLTFLLVGLFIVADLTAATVILSQFVRGVREALPTPPQGLWQIQQVGGGGGFGSVRLVPPGHVLMYLMANVSFCLMLGPLGRPRLRGALALQLLFLGAGLLLTFTRAQWIASGITLSLACLLLPGAARRRLGRALLVGASVLALGIGLSQAGFVSWGLGSTALSARAGSLFQPNETLGTASLQWRTFEDGAAVRAIREHPLLGVGLGNSYRSRTLLQGEASGWLYPLSGDSSLTRFVHNGYLYLAVKMGLVALGAFFGFCIAFLLSGAHVYFVTRLGPAKLLVLAAVCSFVGLLEWGVFEPHFMLPASMATVGVLVGMVMGVGSIRPSSQAAAVASPTTLLEWNVR